MFRQTPVERVCWKTSVLLARLMGAMFTAPGGAAPESPRAVTDQSWRVSQSLKLCCMASLILDIKQCLGLSGTSYEPQCSCLAIYTSSSPFISPYSSLYTHLDFLFLHCRCTFLFRFTHIIFSCIYLKLFCFSVVSWLKYCEH